MKWINYIMDNTAALLALVIIVICLCVVFFVMFLLYRLESEKRVTRAAVELKKITNSIRAGLVHFVLEDNCKILYASKGFYDILGYDKNKTKVQNKNSLLDYIHSKDLAFTSEIEQQLNNETIRCEVNMVTKSGSILNMLMNGNSSKSKEGKHILSVVFVDFTEQKRMQEIILLDRERYRIATELSNDVLFEYDIQKDEMLYTDKYMELFGLESNIPNFRSTCDGRRNHIHPNDWGIYLELCQELSEGNNIIEAEYRIKNRYGEFIWCQSIGKTIYDDNKKPLRVIGKIVNIDAQKRELEALEYKATRDPLTGIYNKEVTIKKIEKYISGNKNALHMLMFIDFDDFKSINDNYGHLIGDKVLVYIVGRIKEIFTEGEIIGRIGGDEFVIFAGNIQNINEGKEKAALLKSRLDTAFISDNNTTIPFSASIGAVFYPESGLHYEQLMDRADQALYRVKEQGKNNYYIFSPST